MSRMRADAGTFLGPYQINALLGIGGMGEVWRARDTNLDRDVAIKLLAEHLAADPDLQERLLREARASAALNHRNICTLYDIGQQDGRHYLVMEYLEGETLAARLERGALPYAEAITLARQIVAALDHAHRHGVIHRDLKPANVILTPNGVKLLDFGLASMHVSNPATEGRRLTNEGALIGTIDYCSPEQLTGGRIDERSDIFSFGVMFYEMLTGKRPFSGENRASIIGAILLGAPAHEHRIQPISRGCRRILRSCLDRTPARRPCSAAKVGAALAQILS